ncbi:MAG: spore germination protein [Christensenellales bacterium]
MNKFIQRNENILKIIKEKSLDVLERTVILKSCTVSLLCIQQLTDRDALSVQVIQPLMLHKDMLSVNAKTLIERIVFAGDCKTDSHEDRIIDYILNGMTVLLFSNDSDYAVINLKKTEKRSIRPPEFMYTMHGPRDSFIEDIDTNLFLIRYRIKDDDLRIERMEVGERSRSSLAVLYLNDVANDTCIKEVKKRIQAIHTDGLCSSGELQAFLLNKKLDLFPQMGIIERSDMACGALLEGKVLVLMDGSPWILVAPKVFSEFLWTCDDFYMNKYIGMFLRILRIIALNLSFVVSALYVGIVSFHNDILPGNYMISIAQSRAKVPFNALIEVLLIEIIAELIHESLIRVPSKIGMAIGIVGAIIIGQAAVVAGVFSPLILIVISLSLIASFVPADHTVVDPFRVLKFPLIIATGTFGFYGFTLFILLILANLVSINTFGVPYMAPLAPFKWKDFFKSIFYSKSMAPTRPGYLRTKNKFRSPPYNNQK